MEAIKHFLAELSGTLWGLPLVCLLVGGGIYYTILLRGIQFRAFKHAIDIVRGKYDKKDDPGEINHFQALCTALSGTVGLGNIAGVAIAIKLGGPGATIWMILTGLVGMATKYSECTLSVMFRKVDEKGVVHGGPMYYIERGLGKNFKLLAGFFAVCCTLGSLGAANMFQSNQVASIFKSNFGVTPYITGLILSFLTGIVIIGGIKRIGNVAGVLVPFMAGIYIFSCLAIIVIDFKNIPTIFYEMFSGAFSGTAAIGGFAGAALKEVLVNGVRRAAFSNEAGMGSAAIAHSAAKTKEPVREGTVALLEPFIDTVVICTLTALVINITEVWRGDSTGVQMTSEAFNSIGMNYGTYFIPIAVGLFAYSTLISWSYYGERSIDYLFGEKGILPYKVLFCVAVFLGTIWELKPVLDFSDSAIALMVIPNMIALLILSPKVKVATDDYYRRLKNKEF
jgi:alanine or glycine:cation symporter, AGCS family